jgi:iron complex outermembrane recepter protein
MMALVASGSAAAQSAAPADGPAANNGIADIVVTANRREEAIQSVPVAISALSNETLREQNIASPTDLLGRVPSLNVASNGTQRDAETITIRGQGQSYLAPVGVVNYFAEVPLIQGSIIANQGGPGTFFDLESLQVLRGPQGTLFGKNTTGGALLLGPRKPVDSFGGYVQAQLGNYNDREFEAVLNVPIVADKLLLRLAGKKVDRDGYTKDVGPAGLVTTLPFQDFTQPPPFFIGRAPDQVLPGANINTGVNGLPGPGDTGPGYRGKDYDDRHYWTVRAGLTFRPVDGVENYLVGYYTKAHNNGSGQVLTSINRTGNTLFNLVANSYGNGSGTGIPFDATDSTIAEGVLADQQARGPRRVVLNNDQFYRLSNWAVTDILTVDLSDTLTFRNVFGYQRMKQSYSWDLDGSFLPVLAQVPATVQQGDLDRFGNIYGAQAGDVARVTNVSLLTEEPQLQGRFLDNRFNVVVGAFYSKQKPEGLQATGSYNGAANGRGFFAITTRSKAVYAQGTLDFGAFTPDLDSLKLTAGIRRTSDRYSGSRISPDYVALPEGAASETTRATTWTLGLDYEVVNNVLLFGKITKGYKAGGFNYAAVQQAGLTFAPEYVKSYEIGAKTDFTLGAVPVRANISAYNLDYDGIQRTFSENVANGCPDAANPFCNTTGIDQGARTFNAGTARVRGVELELTARPTKELTLFGSYSYTKAKYKSYFLDVPSDPVSGPQQGVKDSCDGLVPIPQGVDAPLTRVDLACTPFPFTPENQFSINARYELEMDQSVGTLVFTGGYTHSDRSWTAPASTVAQEPNGYVDAYDVFNASIDWNGIMGSTLDARVFVTNLTNETYRISNSNGDSNNLGYSTSIYSEPRMYGVSLRYRFGEQ